VISTVGDAPAYEAQMATKKLTNQKRAHFVTTSWQEVAVNEGSGAGLFMRRGGRLKQ
jgi:hypothetical protein